MLNVDNRIDNEIRKADDRYGAFTSTHEGFGVLAEEVTELLYAIRDNDLLAVERESIQVAAVATRIAYSMHNPSTTQRSQK
ncbi:unnamed protein product [marine sediment metagenome]|uniref:Uncharacterized protein n=1 Tax=marine sediment metagenome TaxID=412755 RepID=X0UM31_9ZZZZ